MLSTASVVHYDVRRRTLIRRVLRCAKGSSALPEGGDALSLSLSSAARRKQQRAEDGCPRRSSVAV
jgi:hypothetical protein